MKRSAFFLFFLVTIVNLVFSQEASRQIEYGGLVIIDYSNHSTAIHEGIRAKVFKELLKCKAVITDAKIILANGINVYVIVSIKSTDIPLTSSKDFGVQVFLIITIASCNDNTIIAADVITSPVVHDSTYEATRGNAAIVSTFALIKKILSSLEGK